MAVKMRKNWMYVRRIHKGAKGKKSPVTIELSYDADGDMNVVSVPERYDLCGGYAFLEKL